MKLLQTLMLWMGLMLGNLAQAFPTQPVKIITNLPAGSAPDIFARKLSGLLESHWKVPVLVENRPGGAGLVALHYFLRTPNDGHHIFFGDFGFWITMPLLYDKEHLFQQMRPLTVAYNSPWIIVAPPSVKNLADLRQKLRDNPKFGSWGVGSGGHVCGQELSALLKIPTTHVPYKEFGTWFTDTSNGLMSFGCTSVGSSESWIISGKLNYIATAANQRLSSFPNVPTLKELTGHHFESGEAWLAFSTHLKTDDARATKLEQDLRALSRSPEMLAMVQSIKGWPVSSTSAEMQRLRTITLDQYRVLIKKYNITIN